jgi:hypothetical protein
LVGVLPARRRPWRSREEGAGETTLPFDLGERGGIAVAELLPGVEGVVTPEVVVVVLLVVVVVVVAAAVPEEVLVAEDGRERGFRPTVPSIASWRASYNII